MGESARDLFVVALGLAILIGVGIGISRRLRDQSFDRFRLKLEFRRQFSKVVYFFDLIIGFLLNFEGINKYLLGGWIAANLTTIIVLLLIPATALTFAAVVVIWTLHALTIFGALSVLSEETDVWNGLVHRDEAFYGDFTFVKNVPLLFVSSACFVLVAALFALQWDQVMSSRLLAKVPDVSCYWTPCNYVSHYIAYLLAILHDLPGANWVVKQLGYGEDIVFTPRPGVAFSWGVYTATWGWAFGVFRVLFRQYKDINDLIIGLGRARKNDEDTVRYLHMRAARAPSYIKRRLLRTAIEDRSPLTRGRAIAVVPYARIFTFPHRFLSNIHNEGNRRNRVRGLEVIGDFIDKDGRKFVPELIIKNLSALDYQMRENRNAHTPAMIWRLDILVLAFTELALQATPEIPRSKLPWQRLLEIATAGSDTEIRERACGFASTIRPIELCYGILNSIDRLFDDVGDGQKARIGDRLPQCSGLLTAGIDQCTQRARNKLHRHVQSKLSFVARQRRKLERKSAKGRSEAIPLLHLVERELRAMAAIIEDHPPTSLKAA